MRHKVLIDVETFRNELIKHMARVADEAQARQASDPGSASWSYIIRDTAIVHTLDAVVKALDVAIREAE